MLNKTKVVFYLVLILSFTILSGCSNGKPELHHVFPQKYRVVFEKAGIDIDQYALEITKEAHRTGKNALHKGGWNPEWKSFFQKNPSASKAQIMTQMETMLKDNGFLGAVAFKNYRTKVATSVLILTQNKFLDFATTLGTWLMSLLGGTTIGTSVLSFFALIGSSVLGYFGIKAGHPASIGVGVIILIFAFLSLIGVGYIIWYVYPIVITFITTTILVPLYLIFGS